MVLLRSALRTGSYHPSPDRDYCGRFPPGVVNTVPSLGSVGGAALSGHKDVDKVAFTGSTVTGRKIMEAAAKSNLKKGCSFIGRGISGLDVNPSSPMIGQLGVGRKVSAACLRVRGLGPRCATLP